MPRPEFHLSLFYGFLRISRGESIDSLHLRQF